METSILKEFGLTETEIKIYLKLLEEGENLASRISKKANVERAVTYHILEKLAQRGLVSYVIKENRKYFSAAEPEKLKDLLKEKEQALEELIPELHKLKKSEEQLLSVEVFKGKEGLKTILDDLIREKIPYYIIGYTGKAQEIAGFWYSHWDKRRIKNKVKRYVLVRKEVKDIGILKSSLTERRILPEQTIHESKSSIIIYGKDKVVLFLPLVEFAGIRIVNKETHNSYKDYFDVLWKMAKE